jgi:hypothetical protein
MNALTLLGNIRNSAIQRFWVVELLIVIALLLVWGFSGRTAGEHNILPYRWRRILSVSAVVFIVLLILIKWLW